MFRVASGNRGIQHCVYPEKLAKPGNIVFPFQTYALLRFYPSRLLCRLIGLAKLPFFCNFSPRDVRFNPGLDAQDGFSQEMFRKLVLLLKDMLLLLKDVSFWF